MRVSVWREEEEEEEQVSLEQSDLYHNQSQRKLRCDVHLYVFPVVSLSNSQNVYSLQATSFSPCTLQASKGETAAYLERLPTYFITVNSHSN